MSQTVFISGISGTLGNVVSRMLLARGHRVIGYSRDEQNQSKIERRDNLTLYLGCIRDRDRLIEATRGADVILHFASCKMVNVIQDNPEEAEGTIIQGTKNILHVQRLHGIEKVVFTSTDKAAYPINSYGKAKAFAEDLVLRNPRNVVTRYGNVLGSRGSVLPMFVKTLKAGAPFVEITDRLMTRFWTTVERAAHFVIGLALDKNACGLRILEMQAAAVERVAAAVAAHLGVHAYTLREVGVRRGEKLHECLYTDYDAGCFQDLYSNAPQLQMTDAELSQLVGEAMHGIY
jgi:UDP-N-acetylglucosamine 4,6-dehydratase